MAADSVSTASSSKTKLSKKVVRSFKERLDLLTCPYTEDVEESWIMELVFRQGEPRLRLLEWLFCRFDSRLSAKLDPQYTSADTKMNSRIKRLLFVASTLGLCKPDDIEVIMGASFNAKQVSFMDQLLDLVCIMDKADNPETKAMQSPGAISSSMVLEEQFGNDCKFVDVLAGQGPIDSVFSSKAKVLPPDIMKQVEKGWHQKGDANTDKIPIPDIKRLEEMANQLSLELQQKQDILQELNKSHNFPESNVQNEAKVNQTMRLVLSELSQLVVGFSYCFENEMRPWCNKTAPQLTELGPAVKRVHSLLQQFTKMLQSLSSVKSSYNKLTGMKDKVQLAQSKDTTSTNPVFVSTTQAALENFQECIDILEESIGRHEGNISSTTLNVGEVKMD